MQEVSTRLLLMTSSEVPQANYLLGEGGTFWFSESNLGRTVASTLLRIVGWASQRTCPICGIVSPLSHSPVLSRIRLLARMHVTLECCHSIPLSQNGCRLHAECSVGGFLGRTATRGCRECSLAIARPHCSQNWLLQNWAEWGREAAGGGWLWWRLCGPDPIPPFANLSVPFLSLHLCQVQSWRRSEETHGGVGGLCRGSEK